MKQTLTSLTKDLIYISETDAEIVPFVLGKAREVTAKEMLEQLGRPADTPVETVNAEAFFARLTAIKDWFGPRETQRAKRFAELKQYLDEEFNDLKVFKIGKIQIDIYVVGTDKVGSLGGVRTNAVET